MPHIAVLGPIVVTADDGAPVALRSGLQRLLVALLASGRGATSPPSPACRRCPAPRGSVSRRTPSAATPS